MLGFGENKEQKEKGSNKREQNFLSSDYLKHHQYEDLCLFKRFFNFKIADLTDSHDVDIFDELTPEEMARKMHKRIHDCCNLKIKLLIYVCFFHAFFHYATGREGSALQRACYPFGLCLTVIFIKYLLKKFRWME